jgi:pSer/pThr/pTyr-binding forkhead associated (FHA) protein
MAKLQIFLPDDTLRTHDLAEDVVTVGRVADNDLQIEEDSMSSHHAELRLEDGVYVLQDLGSTNGTFCNDEPVDVVKLKEGDRIRFGKVDALFLAEAAEDAGSSAPLPESASSTVSASMASTRPVDFLNSSPFARSEVTSDPVRMGAYALAAIALLLVLFAVYGSLMMIEMPTFPSP